MPRNCIDCSKGLIYKIYCKDEKIKDVYIGQTTDFVRRKFAHKTSCNGNIILKK